MKLTPEQIKGNKFEIWFQELLSQYGNLIFRNVRFKKIPYRSISGKMIHVMRQADIFYQYDKGGKTYGVVTELKFSSNEFVRNKLINKPDRKRDQRLTNIGTVVDETYERFLTINSGFPYVNKIYLATNGFFDEEVKENAAKVGICVIERPWLTKKHIGRLTEQDIKNGQSKEILDDILAVQCDKYNVRYPHIFYPGKFYQGK